MTLDEAWAEAEAALTLQHRNSLGDLFDRRRYDLSVHRLYASKTDRNGNEIYRYEARATLPAIHFFPARGSTPAAALHALATKLRESKS